MESTAKVCSKCKLNPASNGNPWCQPCRTAHAQKIKETEAEMIAVRWWTRGAEAMRLSLARPLACAPGSMIEAHSTAKWMMEQPVPPRPTETEGPRDFQATY